MIEAQPNRLPGRLEVQYYNERTIIYLFVYTWGIYCSGSQCSSYNYFVRRLYYIM